MKTFYIYLLGAILTLFPGYAFAYELNDTDANIIGHVTDKDTKEHLAYVTIMLKGTTIGTTTDETGHYFLKNLPEGTFTVEVSSIGYKTERRTVQLTKGKTLELNFEVAQNGISMDDSLMDDSSTDRRRNHDDHIGFRIDHATHLRRGRPGDRAGLSGLHQHVRRRIGAQRRAVRLGQTRWPRWLRWTRLDRP